MTSPLLGSLAATVNSAFAGIFLDASLTRDVPVASSNPADPATPLVVVYACKAIEQSYGKGVRAGGLVNQEDVQVTILADSVAVDPMPGDRITIRSRTVTIVPGDGKGMPPVSTDPARALWECRCRS